ncbi:Alpha/Beta hydrolase protein [Neurospora tetraspora]|uniref:Alpha/Beta hydrolase protein n=1 Tax=Neurospora tetraspora TaxID=94610 RepID=A0AAE0JEC5_9PEZI|nr:Alpha/Beta hydrolase protein [Neurospora tetraspora]
MFNLNLNLSYQNIHFRHPSSSSSSPIPLPTLPPGISRSFIPTPHGDLEILHTSPSPSTSSQQPALFFIHGGMGSASVWLEYLTFFSAQDDPKIPCYAISMRGHGGSWYPSYLRMVYGTTKGDLAGDVVEGIKWAVGRERERLGLGHQEGNVRGASGDGKERGDVERGKEEEVEMILVGHSAGGGQAQYILSSADLLSGLGVKVKGLVLMGAMPGFGSLPVYLNWFALDPLFTLRLLLHLWHPNSPLSHPSLVRRIFFSSNQLPDSYLSRFMSFMNRYESLLWPLGMCYSFANPEKVLLQISGWGSETSIRTQTPGKRQRQERVLVIAGEQDVIMTQPIMQRLAGWRLVEGKKIDGAVVREEDETVEEEIERDDGIEVEGSGGSSKDTTGMGVRYAIVPGAGHHCQNDVGTRFHAPSAPIPNLLLLSFIASALSSDRLSTSLSYVGIKPNSETERYTYNPMRTQK